MADKDKFFEDVNLMFLEKSMWSSETEIVGISSPEFLQKIKEKKFVKSPSFKLFGVEFYIEIGHEVEPGFISVSLDLVKSSESEDEVWTSVTFEEGSGTKRSWKMDKVRFGCGFPGFLAVEKFKAWAKSNGDADTFKLKATVTVHQRKQDTGDDWIRYLYCTRVCICS